MLWEGSSRDEAASYRLTHDAVHIFIGEDRRRDDVVPLSIVVGIDVGRSPLQRLRGVGDVKLHLDRAVRDFQSVATLANIEEPARVGALVREQADRVRRAVAQERDRDVAALPLVQELREIAALHDAGALTDDEFRRLKARLIDP